MWRWTWAALVLLCGCPSDGEGDLPGGNTPGDGGSPTAEVTASPSPGEASASPGEGSPTADPATVTAGEQTPGGEETPLAATVVPLEEAAFVVVGEVAGEEIGDVILAPGDLTDDGFDDLVIVATGADSIGTNAGWVGVVEGAVEVARSTSDITYFFRGTYDGQRLGRRVLATDIDEDGNLDLLMTADFDDPASAGSGVVYVFLGPPQESLDVSQADYKRAGAFGGLGFGEHLAAADLDGDGAQDLMVSSPGGSADDAGSGCVSIFEGPVDAEVLEVEPELLLCGPEDTTEVGRTAAVGDFNGDGQPDLLVGTTTPTERGFGEIWILYGPLDRTRTLEEPDVTLRGVDELEDFALEVLVGDLDDDGLDDVVVTGRSNEDDRSPDGRAWLFYGPYAELEESPGADALLVGEDLSDGARMTANLIPDQDGDGAPELLIGDPEAYDTFPGEGAAYLFTEPPLGQMHVLQGDVVYRGVEGDRAGTTGGSAGDIDDDGDDDWIITAPGSSLEAEVGGALFFFYTE